MEKINMPPLYLLLLLQNLIFSMYCMGFSWNPEASLSQKQIQLSPYFSPPIGEKIELVEAEKQEITMQTLEQSHGEILVSPPQGTCFTIRLSTTLPDRHICKPTVVPFRFLDLTKDGHIQWTVFLNSHDNGTPISWQTPYVIGYAILEDKNFVKQQASDKHIQTVALDACIDKTTIKKRAISFRLLGLKEKWNVSFPEKDKPLPQNGVGPNLAFRTLTNPAKIAAPKEEGEKEKKKEKPAEAAAPQQKETPYDISDSPEDIGLYEELDPDTLVRRIHLSPSVPSGTPFKKPDVQDSRISHSWTLRPRGIPTFTMNGGHVSSQNIEFIGMLSRCRYRYSHFPNSPSFGALECYNLPGFVWLLLPLPPSCIAPIQR